MRIEPENDRDRIVDSWLALKAKDGTYALNRHALTWSSKASERGEFSVDFPWPRRVPPGEYGITVYECRDGSVVRHRAKSLPVVQVGVVGWLASLSTNHAVRYGLGCVIVAVLVGFGTDWLITLIFGKQRKVSAH